MALHQFDYIFAISMIFAFLDAFNIGANDVANSFASSISSKSLTFIQAMCLAAICEFLGAVLVGNKVSATIKNNIIDASLFENDPATLMLAMACALIGSSTWLTIATSLGLPVSTTHSIVGGVIGAAVATRGAENVIWGWDGVAQIIASWFIAPLISGAFSSIVFLISKYGVLERKTVLSSLRNGMILGTFLVFLSFSVLTMLIVWKGAPSLDLDELSNGAIAGSILGVGGVALCIYLLFVLPFWRRKLIFEDWTLKWYDIFRGPIFWFKSTDNIPPMPEGHQLTIDYYEGRRQVEKAIAHADDNEVVSDDKRASDEIVVSSAASSDSEPEEKTSQRWARMAKTPSKWPTLVWEFFTHGVTKDVISMQTQATGRLGRNIGTVHEKSKFYDNKVEYMYSLLQAITACTMSFAHGANDISNAAGPLSAVYQIWTTNTTGANLEVPVWVLCFTAGSLVIGLWTFGYRIVAILGNKLILQSPSRGFAIEIGAAITTVFATQLSIPVSTTQCATGSTVFVGLCNKNLKAVNWKIVIWAYMGWILTLPIAGIISGIICGIIINAPRSGVSYTME